LAQDTNTPKICRYTSRNFKLESQKYYIPVYSMSVSTFAGR